MKIKKLLATLLCCMVASTPVLGLAACGEDDGTGEVQVYLTYSIDYGGHKAGDRVKDDNGEDIRIEYRLDENGSVILGNDGKPLKFLLNDATIDGIQYTKGEEIVNSLYGSVQEFVSDGNAVKVVFWINGNDTELGVFDKIVSDFNAEYSGRIQVKLMNRTSSSYGSALEQSLNGSSPPDVFYVGDADYKRYARYDYMLNIDAYLASSTINTKDMWSNVRERYLFDPNTWLSGTDSGHMYGLPKDLGPTVIFYNESYFETAGIKVISVDEKDLAAFNAGDKTDDRGQSKATIGVKGENTDDVKPKGFWRASDGQYWFNNQVPMSWEETDACAALVQDAVRASTGRKNIYGYFTEWWFNYGWSVGGNCVQQIDTDNSNYRGYYYDFTLMDNTPNYIVNDDVQSVTVNGKTYKAGELIAYQDKIDMSTYEGLTPGDATKNKKGQHEVSQAVKDLCEAGTLNQLPSQREAFTEFVQLAATKDSVVDEFNGKTYKGYGITATPTSLGSDAAKTDAFVNGVIAMLVDGRWNVTDFRKDISDKNKFKWDVAPLPMYKQYDEEGNITVHGVEAGHSGSVSLSISKKSKVADAAWKFIEFCCGEVGQTRQAEKGFAIPTLKSLANSEVFLQSHLDPKNSKIFIDATEYEKAGDWWQLYDNEWINDWANDLNSKVRNGQMTLSGFYNGDKYNSTFEKLDKYSRK